MISFLVGSAIKAIMGEVMDPDEDEARGTSSLMRAAALMSQKGDARTFNVPQLGKHGTIARKAGPPSIDFRDASGENDANLASLFLNSLYEDERKARKIELAQLNTTPSSALEV
tara:strand:+ start:279 stop:620 length:342 start_codon:yes stop_codon:yes gene_type:complete